MSEEEQTHVCEECGSTEAGQYFFVFVEEGEREDIWLCDAHAKDSFCLWCHYYGAGSEEFDFSDVPGYHQSCLDDMQAELGEDCDDEDLDFGWDYNASWYDPDAPELAALEDPETPQTIWIGPDVCTHCGSMNTQRIDTVLDEPVVWVVQCGDCGKTFEVQIPETTVDESD